ncbi:MAG: M23 family metallopeptidase [Muribaculaceae bacterium]|nr:M23 family metallopeptidase [Muribaculaceae bacterium]
MNSRIGRIVLIIIALLSEAPDFSGAFAQSVNPDVLTGLVRSVKDTKVISPDSIENPGATDRDISDILSFLGEYDTDSVASPLSGTGQILENIISYELSPEKASSSSLTVLDFMTKVYHQHDFYQSGSWDEAEDFSYITDNVVLPPYDPEDFHRPVWGRITSTFGYRPSFKRVHKGIDLALNVGDTVKAALPGVVARVGYDAGGYGHFVVMVHNNGMETRYAHLQKAVSSPGDRLEAGDPLGLGGNTGNSTGPHLHFEIRYRGSAIDPSSVFDFSRRQVAKGTGNKRKVSVTSRQ